jgi:hypothetical protein
MPTRSGSVLSTDFRIKRINHETSGAGRKAAGRCDRQTLKTTSHSKSRLVFFSLRLSHSAATPRRRTSGVLCDPRVVGGVDDDSLVLEARGAEIQQQSTAAARDAQIVDHLRHFDRANRVKRLQLDES